jgi:hypothetical protein
MAARIHKQLKVIVFHANAIWRRRYELCKQLRNLYRRVALLSETHLKPHEKFLFQIIAFIGLAASREEKVFPITMQTYAICGIRTFNKGEAYS